MPVTDPAQLIDELHVEAAGITGLTDFGPTDYREPLLRAVTEIEQAELTETGRAWFRHDVVNALAGRLVREDSWKRHPEYATRRIVAPLVICGVPRTGTTALHKVMSQDPQFQGLNHWLTHWPLPRPPRELWDREPGFHRAAAALEALYELNPALRGQHEVSPDELDECFEVLRLDFVTNTFPSSYHAPEYDAWLRRQDETPYYRRLADTIRLIGLHDDRTWLLKNPAHIGQLGPLFTVFPDARVIVTHRDPVKSIGSVASLLAGVQRMSYRNPDPTEVGRRELGYWAQAEASARVFRAANPDKQFIDIDHADFHRDPITTVRHVYDRFDLELTPPVERAMRTWLAANPADKHGAHRYDIEDYGITAAQVHAAFAAPQPA